MEQLSSHYMDFRDEYFCKSVEKIQISLNSGDIIPSPKSTFIFGNTSAMAMLHSAVTSKLLPA